MAEYLVWDEQDEKEEDARRIERYEVEGSPAMLNYEWPNGRKQAVPKNGRRGYVPPCEGKR